MSLSLNIGGRDMVNRLTEGSLVLRHYGAHRSSFAATLELSSSDPIPSVGQEIVIRSGTDLIWGGILIEVDAECHAPDSAQLRLRGQGYEQVFQRLCTPSVAYSLVSPTEAAEDLFVTFVWGSEPFVIGAVDSASGVRDYHFYPSKLSALMDYLADECGYFWWIDKNKRFYMRSTISDPSAEVITVDLTGESAQYLRDLQTFAFRSSTAGYRNVQYAYNRSTYTDASARNTDEIYRMAQAFGSGEYGAACSSYSITNPSVGASIARQVLNEYPGTDEVRFTTDDDRFRLGQSVSVIAPVCGIASAKTFLVSEIRAVWFYDRFRYSVTAKELLGTGAGTRTRWEQLLAKNNTPEREA